MESGLGSTKAGEKVNILITGIKGFVAGHLYDYLLSLDANFKIYGFSDIDDPMDFSGIKYDCIFHLAAVARTSECIETATTNSHISNVELTRLLLNEFKYDRFIYTSSCAVYGNQSIMPIIEESHMNPLGIYAAQKLYSENLVHYHNKFIKKPSVCLRLFNTYGPKQSQEGKYPNVLASLIRCYKKNGYVEVTGDGFQTRDFVHVEDVVSALHVSMRVQDNQIFNVCSGTKHSINQLASLITKNIKYIPERKQDILHQLGSYKKIHNSLGWTPTVPFKDGVKRALQYELKKGE